jgi:NAD(P)-dependent dehydrogenase (short-subunit alcohol dehydrogenase family)
MEGDNVNEMNGKIVMVTGATNGIGKVSALELAKMGATVIVVSRSAEKCETVAKAIRDAAGHNDVVAMPADLSVQAEIHRLADQFLAAYPRLDVLLNNAGAIYTTREVSKDGVEMTWALDHLNYFLLTNLLLPALKAAPTARVVNVSSGAHAMGKINFDDVQFNKGYSGFKAYSQAKLANIMFTYELAKRLDCTNITTNALHPGAVATGFGQNNTGLFGSLWKLFGRFTLSPEEGAKTSIYLASSTEVAGVTGKYFDKCKAIKSNAASYIEADQKRLWELSAEMVKLPEVTTV